MSRPDPRSDRSGGARSAPAIPAPLIPHRMSPALRRVVHALVFEGIALVLVVVVYSGVSDAGVETAGALAVACSLAAMAWNVAFNWGFEALERRARRRGLPPGRGPLRRIVHAVGFEAGLLVLLAPLIAWALQVTLVEAILYDIGLSAFFVVYAWAFNLGFDRVFGLPDSAT